MRLRTACLGLLGLVNCGEATPGVFFTEHLVVEPYDSEVVCRGTLDDLELQAVRVAESLRVGIPYPIHVHYGPSALAEHCIDSKKGQLLGCARQLNEDTYIAADASSADHELVHAVRAVNGVRGPRFFEEGVALVLSGIWPRPYAVELQAATVARGPEFLVTVPWGDFQSSDYSIAGHFMSWLYATHGDEAVAAFLHDETFESDTTEAFSRIFGVSLAEAEAQWRSSSETVYTWGTLCDPRHELTWTGTALQFSGRLDCAASNTIGPSVNGISTRHHCFTLDQPGTLRVELLAPGGRADLRCVEEDNWMPVTPEHFQPKKVLAGEATDLPFAQCTWRLTVASDEPGPTDFLLRFTRV